MSRQTAAPPHSAGWHRSALQGCLDAELDVAFERLRDRTPVLGALGGLSKAVGVKPGDTPANRERARLDCEARLDPIERHGGA